ncbi:MAG TPA: nuclear transport factor 2 family protein, partial [Pyrinomonadaceae bacterium]
MSETNKALMRRWFEEVWNQGRTDAIDELLADNVVIHGLVDASGEPVRGAQAFRDFHRQFRGAFPNMNITVEDVIAEGDRA